MNGWIILGIAWMSLIAAIFLYTKYEDIKYRGKHFVEIEED